MQQVLTKDEHLTDNEFDLYTRGSFDFVVSDSDRAARFALEIDGLSHDTPRQLARDLIKNDLCYRAGLPLLRLGSLQLAEREETSVLEWLVHALVESEAGSEGSDVTRVRYDDTDGLILGDPGIEIDYPFPDNALISNRLRERYALDLGDVDAEFTIIPDGADYILDIDWPGSYGVGGDARRAASFVTTQRRFKVGKAQSPTVAVFEGAGRAEFAWANRLPFERYSRDALAPTGFPWDALCVAIELAEFDALRQTEAWARTTLRGP